MAKKTGKKVLDPYTRAIAKAEDEAALLDALLEYLEVLQGSLDLILEHLDSSGKVISDIGVKPDKALDSAIEDLNDKLIQVRAKRVLASGITLSDEETIH